MANVPVPLVKAMDAVRGFSLAQRTIALIGVAVLVLGSIALVTFVSQPKMTPLFSGLAPEDAAGIVEQLKADAVPYELTGGGGTILVPEANVYDSRLKAAAAGMPSAGSSGYSLLDNMGVTSSEFQQSVTYKRALEGELASTISALEGIKLASVKLAIPEQTVFVDSKTNPTASIFVQTKPNETLSSNQVQAIVHLTSAAVDGLRAEDISVVDSTGKLLSAAGAGLTGGAEKQAADYESRVASVIQNMLDRVVGPGNATVAVAADLSLESAERTEESFTNPDGAPALVETNKQEDYKGTGGGPAAGVLGPDNIAVPNGNTGDGTFSSKDTTRTNAVNKVTENRQIPSGTLNRQSVSVALNSAVVQGLDVGEITQMVSSAAGIDTARNDTVNVSVVPFNADAATAAQNALAAAADAETAIRTAALQRSMIIGGVIGLALILFTVYALYVRRNKQSREPVDLGELREFESLVPAHVPEVSSTETIAISQIPIPEPVAPLVTPQHVKRDQLAALAASDPEKMADYLRTVMDDRGTV